MTEKIQLSITNPNVAAWLQAQTQKTGATWQGTIRQILYERMLADMANGKTLADRVWTHEKGEC